MLYPKDLKAKLLKLWDSGKLLRAEVVPQAGDEALFPLCIPLGRPVAAQLLNEFTAVGSWKQAVEASQDSYRIAYTEVNHRRLGRQRLPTKVCFDSAEQAAAFLGKRTALTGFRQLNRELQERHPALTGWIERRPLKLLEYQSEWPALLAVLDWFIAHPRSGLYVRELAIPGVDSKFIEGHRGLLVELLDRVLPQHAIDARITGLARHGFERRYGLNYELPQVRFRLLDSALSSPFNGLDDLSIPLDPFSKLAPDAERVFITENKVNGLCFPPVPAGMVIFGLGYGVKSLKDIPWLADKALYYWGDLDTHGFAILSQLRGYYPQTRSLLMDRNTLEANRHAWVREPAEKRYRGELSHLDAAEQTLFRSLRDDLFGEAVRLEQERVPFDQVLAAITKD